VLDTGDKSGIQWFVNQPYTHTHTHTYIYIYVVLLLP